VKLGTKGGAVSRIDWKGEGRGAAGGGRVQPGHRRVREGLPAGGHRRDGRRLDKKQEKCGPRKYRALLAHSPYLGEYVKEFNDYLASWRRGS